MEVDSKQQAPDSKEQPEAAHETRSGQHKTNFTAFHCFSCSELFPAASNSTWFNTLEANNFKSILYKNY
jgi:hypothetical protein